MRTRSKLTSVYIGARCSESSTEHFLYLDEAFDKFYLELHGWPSRQIIGYAEYEFVCQEGANVSSPMLHALTRVLPASAQCPGPVIPLTAVLYRSQEARKSLRAFSSSYPEKASSTPLSGSEEESGGFPHGT